MPRRSGTARTEAERAAAEAERQRREAEEAARIAAAEARARAQTLAGLAPEEIRKAEELANWDFVKDRSDIQDLRDHLARFPGGTTERYALARLDGLVWAAQGPGPGIGQLRAYLDEFPQGAHAEAAQARLVSLERKAAEGRTAEATARVGAAGQSVRYGVVIVALVALLVGGVLVYWMTARPAPAPPPKPEPVVVPPPPKPVVVAPKPDPPVVAFSPSRAAVPLTAAECSSPRTASGNATSAQRWWCCRLAAS